MNKILRFTFVAAMAFTSLCGFSKTVTIDFNANGLKMFDGITAVSSSSTTAGDFTEDKTATVDGVTLTVSKSTSTTANRMWGTNAGPQLRIYGGTLKISSSQKITKIVFDKGTKWQGVTASPETLTDATWTNSGANEVTFTVTAAKGNQIQINKIEITLADESGDNLAAPTISGNTSFTESATVTITAADGATIYYTTNGQEPDDREGTQYTAPFTISETTTVKAIAYKGDLESSIATQEFTKKEAQKLTGEGTLANPYTCADVIALENGQQAPSDSVYVKGKVSQAATSLNTTYGDINFYLSDDGTTTSQIEAYNSYYYKRAKYTSESQMPKLGDEVVLYGKITSFNNTIELARGNYLVSLKSSGVKVDTLSFTASEALAALTAGTQPTGVCYITGIVSKVDTTGIGQYGSITYYISDDGTTTNQLEVYHGKSFNGEKFTKDFFLKEGDKVKILGQLINYTKDGNVTPEVTSYSKLIELNGKTTGITEIKADKAVLDANAPMYNLAGQRVDKSFKGIVIQKGHKFLNK